jgi:acetylornithine deacetylase/succinyl-diaminopimelate desuccinylase-like protein
VYGGVVLNPLQALTSIVASLYNKDGSVAVPGFYDHVKPVSDEDKKLANSAPINVGDMQEMLGVSLAGGERGVPVMERRGFRPTLELNGIGGGYQGAGGKTVIPSHAFAKFSMRLVKGQEPQETFDIVVRHLEQMRVEGVRIEVHDKVVSGPALSISSLSPVIKKAREAIVKAFGQEPVYLWEGASIPIVAKLAVVSGADPLLVGFGEEGDKIHAPDESFSLRQLQEGFRYVTSFFSVV